MRKKVPSVDQSKWQKFKLKLKAVALDVVSVLAISLPLVYLALKVPELHGQYLRAVVGSKVYKIVGKLDGGGGTGFAVEAPSGTSYILTNSHVCEHAMEQHGNNEVLVVSPDGTSMPRRVLESSNFTDLCLIEGLPGVSGLKVGSAPNMGEIAAVVGHPRLRPMSLSRGEIVGSTDVELFDFVMKGNDPFLDAMFGARDGKCNLPKQAVKEIDIYAFDGEPVGKIKVCVIVIKSAYMSTIVVHGGNSGSPMVDFWGNVKAVVFANDNTTWGYMVSNEDLKRFLSKY